MFFLNLPHTVTNVLKFVHANSGIKPCQKNLKELFTIQLSQIQKSNLTLADLPLISFGTRRISRTQEAFMNSGFGFIEEFTPDEEAPIKDNFKQSLLLIQKIDSRLFEMLRILISDIVFIKSPLKENKGGGSGTSSHVLGVIWITPGEHWAVETYVESILHEFMHVNLFLGEAVYGLYKNKENLDEQEALVMSAIKRIPRPLDRAFHAACVATVLVYFYHLLDQKNSVKTFLEPLIESVSGLVERQDYFSAYGQAIIQQMSCFTTDPDFDYLRKVINDRQLAQFHK
ncbi:MAG: HEXXH motif-containing putative peptide modification protein [Tychonema bourrellyi B0820]|uniref:HEXXH motif domain-containing protein n=1 Tax=Tychonema bourrellyi FEM_GT703 TaxID=2040638 RepID=A0A2G4F6H6_9CYAN|nr:HEXXH motif-containing putative peptide modification protein [Tychonema bourrellyi]MDQ2097204.1 HEXXH motif-containing putative peptide modification protein [Tychonema bourrellyi B0820]PHX57394.1 hypothetical protein CP500_000180 [Tychonema bourrellyi FEM_GT703]